MIKKTIKYEDFDGNQREEDFWFNLNKVELSELQLDTPGGFTKYAERISKEQDGKALFDIFKKLILKSYGEKSDDGKYFRKSPEIVSNFESTNAFEALITEFENEKAFIEFFIGTLPKDMQNELKQKIASGEIKF